MIDLRGNLLREDDCPTLEFLSRRVAANNGVLHLEPQRGDFGFPTYDQWPVYNVLEIIFGTILIPEPLPCDF